MNRDILLVSLIFAIIFLLGVQVLADTRPNYSIETPEEDFVITVKPLPSSKLNLIESDSAPARATASLNTQEEDSDFKITVHPVAENR